MLIKSDVFVSKMATELLRMVVVANNRSEMERQEVAAAADDDDDEIYLILCKRFFFFVRTDFFSLGLACVNYFASNWGELMFFTRNPVNCISSFSN